MTVLFLIIILAFPFSANANDPFHITYSADWRTAELSGRHNMNLAGAGIRMPGGRFLAEDMLDNAFPRLLREHLLSIIYDSSNTIGDLIESGRINLRDLDNISRSASRSPPNLSNDFSELQEFYNLCLDLVSSYLRPIRRAYEVNPPLIPMPSAPYTGIIIIANEMLPLHGRESLTYVQPGLFPKIYDNNMNLVYEREMFESGIIGSSLMVRYSNLESILGSGPSGIDEALHSDLASLLGSNPLRIFARSVFGIFPVDLIIDQRDAILIHSTENNRRLLREGRVLLVLDDSVL